MRNLTTDEILTRDRRRSTLSLIIAERQERLTDFGDAIDLPSGNLVASPPEHYLFQIDAFMALQTIDSADDYSWAHSHLSVYVGELFVVRYGGRWFLNELPDSRFFLRLVVGQFQALGNTAAMLDPFWPIGLYLDEPPPRSLSSWVARLDLALREA